MSDPMMPPVDWPRVKEVFAAVLPLAPDARSAYLEDACHNDATVRQQVEALLLSHGRAASFLESPVSLPESIDAPKNLEGRCVGPYRLESQIGAGGMGDVYKAQDTRLGRIVAIKVLPPPVAADRIARDRFEREARAVAALNHPHICTLYDIGSQDGIDFLVMEYLEGETLAVRLERGRLAVTQALQYGIQIASALDTVHRAGIVHRDLKPGNIMLTKDGAKLLDFGLANAAVSSFVSNEHARTASWDLTSAGTILGTVQYMAPEQIEGKRADTRSDIFAFGAVLYEMIAGEKAFKGDSFASLMTAIREHEPAPLAEVSASANRIIRTCLVKDPDDRWQTARDLLRELVWLADADREMDASGAAAAAGAQRARAVAWTLSAIASVMTVLLAWVGYLYVNTVGRAPVSGRFEVATPPTSDPMSLALSPDGRHLAFVAIAEGAPKLFLRPLDQVTAQVLIGTDGASHPFWAPDGRALAFFAGGKLKRTDLAGGLPQVISDAPTGRGGTWSRDGVILFSPTTGSTLMRVPAAGGVALPATRFAGGETSHRWPQFLPDGRHFLFLSTQGQSGTQGVFLGALDTKDATRVLGDDAPAVYAHPGKLLIVRQGALVAIPFDVAQGAVTGEPVRVIQPIGFDSLLVRAPLSISENGVLAYRTAIAQRRRLVWVDRAGTTRGTVGPIDDQAMAAPELSGDGRRVAVFRTVDGNADVWLMQTSGGIASRFTFSSKVEGFPVWSSDGQRVVFLSNRDGDYGLFQRPASGGRDDQPLLRRPDFSVPIPLDFSRDGRFLLFAVKGLQTGIDLWAQPLDRNSAPFAVIQTPFDEMAGQLSPDGRWVAYQSNASGTIEVYVSRFPGPGEAQRVSSAGGEQPRWSPDGKELFYVAADNRMMAVPIRVDPREQALDAGSPVALFAARLATGANIPPAVGSKQQYDIAPDGRFLMNVSVEGAAAPPITVALNWQASLTQ